MDPKMETRKAMQMDPMLADWKAIRMGSKKDPEMVQMKEYLMEWETVRMKGAMKGAKVDSVMEPLKHAAMERTMEGTVVQQWQDYGFLLLVAE